MPQATGKPAFTVMSTSAVAMSRRRPAKLTGTAEGLTCGPSAELPKSSLRCSAARAFSSNWRMSSVKR